MSLILLSLGFAVFTAGILAFFWDKIRAAITAYLIPWVKTNIDTSTAELISKFIISLDEKMTATRNMLKTGWNSFNSLVLKRNIEYTTDANLDEITGQRTTYIRKGDKIAKITETTNLDFDELPDDFREKLVVEIGKHDNQVEKKFSFNMDEKKQIFDKAKEKLMNIN